MRADKAAYGDWSFSLEALDLIIEKCSDKFTPISAELMEYAYESTVDKKLWERIGRRRDRLPTLQIGDTEVVTVMVDDSCYLLFWQAMNKLLGAARRTE